MHLYWTNSDAHRSCVGSCGICHLILYYCWHQSLSYISSSRQTRLCLCGSFHFFGVNLLIINLSVPIRHTFISESKMILANNFKSMSVTYLPTGKSKSNCSLDGIQQSWRNWNVQSEIDKSPFHFHEYYEDFFDPYWGISWEYFILQNTLWVSPALTCRTCWKEPAFRKLRLFCRCILLNICLAASGNTTMPFSVDVYPVCS